MVLRLGTQELRNRGAEAVDISKDIASLHLKIPSSDVKILEGHKSEVCMCAWSPAGSLLASGSGDSTARIWDIADGPSTLSVNNGLLKVVVLKHLESRTKRNDVTALDWNLDGTLLATGSFDGHASLWSKDGSLKSTLDKHQGPIFSLKWNKVGSYLLSGSVDKTAIVWDIRTREWKQRFEFHTGPILDVDWRNSVSFATCSIDSMIYVCNIGEKRPLKSFCGHQGDVNAIKWDPNGTLLASCSDDCTAKVWSMKQNKYLHNLRGHEKEVYAIKWSPTGPGSSNPNKKLILASASFDSTIKLWNAKSGSLLCTLNGHRGAVYTVAFSHDGEYLASGSSDNCVNIWSVKDGQLVKTYTGKGCVFEVCWNREGNKVAACFANNVVCVLDIRM